MVTDLQGRWLDFSAGRRLERNRGVVATNGRLHSQVLQAVEQVLETKP
jgi:3'(2'), 5'-bisphosphate nucleotidase